MKIYNGTAHQINIYTLDQCDGANPRKLIVKDGESPIYTIPAGINLNAEKGNAYLPTSEKYHFPVKGAVVFHSVDQLPETEDGEDYDIYIVSNLYRAACVELGEDTCKLATVDGVVYSDPSNPRPCGCLGLAIG